MNELTRPLRVSTPSLEVTPNLSPPSNKPLTLGERQLAGSPGSMVQRFQVEIMAMTDQVACMLARCGLLLRDERVLADQDVLRDLGHLRERITAISIQLVDTLQTLDRVLQRPLCERPPTAGLRIDRPSSVLRP